MQADFRGNSQGKILYCLYFETLMEYKVLADFREIFQVNAFIAYPWKHCWTTRCAHILGRSFRKTFITYIWKHFGTIKQIGQYLPAKNTQYYGKCSMLVYELQQNLYLKELYLLTSFFFITITTFPLFQNSILHSHRDLWQMMSHIEHMLK